MTYKGNIYPWEIITNSHLLKIEILTCVQYTIRCTKATTGKKNYFWNRLLHQMLYTVQTKQARNCCFLTVLNAMLILWKHCLNWFFKIYFCCLHLFFRQSFSYLKQGLHSFCWYISLCLLNHGSVKGNGNPLLLLVSWWNDNFSSFQEEYFIVIYKSQIKRKNTENYLNYFKWWGVQNNKWLKEAKVLKQAFFSTLNLTAKTCLN